MNNLFFDHSYPTQQLIPPGLHSQCHLFFFYVYCLFFFLYAHHMLAGACGRWRKKVLDLLDLELQVFVSCVMWVLGPEPSPGPWQEQQVLLFLELHSALTLGAISLPCLNTTFAFWDRVSPCIL